MATSGKGKVAIIGSGLIGQSWAMIFVSAGYKVQLYDNQPEKVIGAVKSLDEQLNNLESKGILRGQLSAQQQSNLISGATSLSDCLQNAFWVQECVFEDVDLKRDIFTQLDNLVSDEAILASSTSFIPPSKFMENLKHRGNALVNHPVNPPYFAPLTELVPSPWTKPEIVSRAKKILFDVGSRPIVVKKEVPGFIINRIQDAIFAEAYNLIDDDVIDVDDLDAVMSEGLGMRYAFMGPWETAHLNANGMVEYFEKYAQGIHDVQSSFKPIQKMEGPTAKKIIDAMLTKVPMNQLAARRKWRDEMMIKLSQIKKGKQ
ncbi:lambda-crystallin-like [Panonychus citri]|uniref:lambda-crystallin-like n=1 Tax=Panonychus citri TaxID=50023 RepID=UPI002307277C|nr:lambda-crystallin-like [Panonychus citri]